MDVGEVQRASAFGEDPAQYDRARPSYSSELVDDLVQGRRLRVLDVGCGTGIAGRQFISRGCEVHGVEHDPRMAAVARLAGLDVEVAAFEAWAPAGAPFDLVVSAQAWHWVDREIGPRKAAGVLSDRGELAVLWIEYRHRPHIAATLQSVYSSVAPQLLGHSYPVGAFPERHPYEVADGYIEAINASGAFQTPTMRSYPMNRTYTVEHWLDELPTHSDHRVLPPRTLNDLLTRLRAMLSKQGETFDVTLTSHVVAARRC